MKIFRRPVLFLAALLAVHSVQPAFAQYRKAPAELKTLARLALSNYKTDMTAIHKQDLDVAGINFPQKQVDLLVTPTQLKSLKKQGFKVIYEQSALESLQASLMAPDTRYQTPAKVEAALKQFNQQYPALTELVNVGKSFLGRDIWAIKITNSQTSFATKKPAILVNGMHHAREVMSSEVPLDMIQYLLSNYGKDTKVTHWVDANEIYVLPMFNVDGNNIVWTQDNMWRKNARDSYGVDINRNYPYAWNSCNGSSSSRGAQDFHGDSAGSEPETQDMMAFVSKIRPVFDISFHSYSELVIYPYGCENTHTPTKEVVEGIGAKLASLLPSDSGSGTYTAGTAPELLYSVDGGDIDWMYHDAQVIPYVIELNASSQGFQPSYDQWRDKTVNKLHAAWGFLLDRLDGSALRGVLVGENRAPVSGSTVTVSRGGTQPFLQEYKVNADGSFHIVLNPGMYSVTYAAPGYRTLSNTISIGSTRSDVTVQVSKN